MTMLVKTGNELVRMQYNEHQLAQLAATIAAGLGHHSRCLDEAANREKTRAAARDLANVSLLARISHRPIDFVVGYGGL